METQEPVNDGPFYAINTQILRRAVMIELDDGSVMQLPEEKVCIAWRGTSVDILLALLNAGWAAQTKPHDMVMQ